MRPTHRRTTASVIERLLAKPQAFEFVQAVSILLAWLARQGVAPEQAWRDCLRFENSLGLGFPASEIEAIAHTRTEVDAAAADAGHRFTITPAFMGLLGAHGVLPAHVTERIAAWQSAGHDAAPRTFLDLVSNRMLALFWRAWQKNRIAHMPAGGADRLRPLLLALAGSAPESSSPSRSDAAPPHLVAHFAGMLAQRPCSAVVIEQIVSAFFGVAVRLEEAVGHWDRLGRAEQAALGINAELGENVLLGERSWRPDLRARLRIGPLDAATFARFLPSGDASAALRAILGRCAEPSVGFEIQLVLRAQDVRPLQLPGRTHPANVQGRLGRDSFLGAGQAVDRADMRYLMLPMAALPALPARSGPATSG
ncbi:MULTISPECIES: type VI secretion system baseplate subunit TssG [unclassified Massilia]|uniref:type VI secretion system baseplate subunit TssG n=1 Tax=unclassified Massilia TaxID=2609279 RepID=UPI0017866023|nr:MULTISPECIES: type VI secretion system baseplate subunit TssG [unclassified Massilia]MBD8531199.1 type VI secretion system baseplate subunit TssG [Massilia sp. CFBP 13647]MBD8675035.1 type VI secretion system baseplate subunit TssG [Massilia sp. CFBP 13721]